MVATGASRPTYDAFGEVRTESGTLSTDFLFTGEQFDAKARQWQGLYYLRARYYDPSTGRFLTQDPLRGWFAGPRSLNPYVYAVNNPALYVDPTGLWPWDDLVDCLSNPIGCGRKTAERVANWGIDVTYPYRTPLTGALEKLISGGSWGDRRSKEGATIIQNCQGLCRLLMDYPLQSAEAFTVGHTIFARGDIMNRPATLQEELNHVRQYELLGDFFLVTYLANVLVALPVCGTDVQCHRNLNILERTAQP